MNRIPETGIESAVRRCESVLPRLWILGVAQQRSKIRYLTCSLVQFNECTNDLDTCDACDPAHDEHKAPCKKHMPECSTGSLCVRMLGGRPALESRICSVRKSGIYERVQKRSSKKNESKQQGSTA